MYLENQDISLWFGTDDAPAPEKSIDTGAEVAITIGISPADITNKVEVVYRINRGPTETLTAVWQRHDVARQAQYFKAHFPALRTGDTVEYTVVGRCAGRQVPAPEEVEKFVASFVIQEAGVDLSPSLATNSSSLSEADSFLDKIPNALSLLPEIQPERDATEYAAKRIENSLQPAPAGKLTITSPASNETFSVLEGRRFALGVEVVYNTGIDNGKDYGIVGARITLKINRPPGSQVVPISLTSADASYTETVTLDARAVGNFTITAEMDWDVDPEPQVGRKPRPPLPPPATVTIIVKRLPPTPPRAYIVSIGGQETNGARGADPPRIVSPVGMMSATIPVTIWGEPTGTYKYVKVGAIPILSSPEREAKPTLGPNGTPETVFKNARRMRQWTSEIEVGPNLPPSIQQLEIVDEDIGDEIKKTNFQFEIIDKTPPLIEIFKPIEDQDVYLQVGEKTAQVTVKGRVIDTQTGYRTGSLKYIFNGRETTITNVKPNNQFESEFEFVIPSVGLGPQRITVIARDSSQETETDKLPGNRSEITLEFTVASDRPKTIDEFLSQRSYLADLIRFTSSHVFDITGSSDFDSQKLITSKILSQSFIPNDFAGTDNFFGELLYAPLEVSDRIVNELLPAVALLRILASIPILEDPLPLKYIRSVYEALLIAHGTSYEELRALPAPGTPERRAIAERLGLAVPTVLAPKETDDGLDILLLRNGATVGQLESDLFDIFNLPLTIELLVPRLPRPDVNLLKIRQHYLTRRWQAEDAKVPTPHRPLLDPDLVDETDLNPARQDVVTLLKGRIRELETQWNALRNVSDVNAALAIVYPQAIDGKPITAKLKDIEDADQKGTAIAPLLLPLGLTLTGFRRLRFYQQLQQPLSEREKEDLAYLLTQAWKLYNRYSTWVNDEKTLAKPLLSPLWPSSVNTSAFVTGQYKRDFLPWRGNVFQRIEFEKLVTARLEDIWKVGNNAKCGRKVLWGLG